MQNTLFLILIINGILSVIFDLASNVMVAYEQFHTPAGRDALFAVNMLYFFVHGMQPAIFARYIMHIIGLTANDDMKSRIRFYAPLILVEFFLLTNPYTHLFFTIDDRYMFRRGPLEYSLYGVGAFYLGVALFTMVRYREGMRKEVLRAMGVYYGIVVIGSVIQLIVPVLTTELFFEALAFLGLMLTFEEDDADIDEITHLRNRTAFRWDNMKLLVTKRVYYIVNIKISNLKFYSRIMNGTGYHRLLVSISEWVKNLSRGADVYHFDDNYTLLIYQSTEEEIRQLIDVIREMLEKSWYFDELEAHFRIFISVAKVPEDIHTIDSVFDLVEFENTSESEHVLVQYRESLAQVKREAAVERALRKAIVNRSFQVYYQPIYNCETERVSCAEALVRLFDDELGQIPPAEFIPIAEKSAMIVEIGDIIFEKVALH